MYKLNKVLTKLKEKLGIKSPSRPTGMDRDFRINDRSQLIFGPDYEDSDEQ